MRRKKYRHIRTRYGGYRVIEYRETPEEHVDRLTRTNTFLRRHPAPFNKTPRGKQRREERRFTHYYATHWLTSNNHGAEHDYV